MLRASMVPGAASAYTRSAASKINECAMKAHTDEQAGICSEDGEGRCLCALPRTFLYSYLHQFAPLQLERGARDFLFLYLFPSASNIITRMSGCFVQENVACTALRLWRRGTVVPEKCQKKLKEMAKLGSPTSFLAASFHSFVFVHSSTSSLFHRTVVLSNRSYG